LEGLKEKQRKEDKARKEKADFVKNEIKFGMTKMEEEVKRDLVVELIHKSKKTQAEIKEDDDKVYERYTKMFTDLAHAPHTTESIPISIPISANITSPEKTEEPKPGPSSIVSTQNTVSVSKTSVIKIPIPSPENIEKEKRESLETIKE
jgi:hypothetical protein